MEFIRKHLKAPVASRQAASVAEDEALVSDVRAGVTPSEMVERKLITLLKSIPLPLSRLQAKGTPRPRF